MRHLDVVVASVDRDRWGHMDGWDGGWMWLWGIAMTVLFVVLVVWVVRTIAGGHGSSQTTPPDPRDRAREILAERYARGELTTEEYRERVDQLR
jgi:putative membrane protein